MIVVPRAVLIPDWRVGLAWLGVSTVFALLLIPLGSSSIVLCVAALAALWADSCVRRLHIWQGSALVPGYATTVTLVAVGTVGTVVALAETLWPLVRVIVLVFYPPSEELREFFDYGFFAGRTPVYGVAMLLGILLVLGLSYVPQRVAVRNGLAGLVCVALAVVFAATDLLRTEVTLLGRTLGGGLHVVGVLLDETSRVLEQPTVQWIAGFLAVLAAAVLRWQLARPGRELADRGIASPAHFRPFIAGPDSAMAGGTSGLLVVAVAALIAVPAYGPFETTASLAPLGVGLLVFLGALTPTILLNAAGTWLSTAWRLGMCGSRRHLGRLFAIRVVTVTAVSFAVALAVVTVHAMLALPMPADPGHRDHIDELLVLYAVGLAAFSCACWLHPRRTTKQHTQFAALGVVCATLVAVSFNPLSFDFAGRALLGLALLASAGLAIGLGGRGISRVDFLVPVER